MSPMQKEILEYCFIFLFANLIHLSNGLNQYANLSNASDFQATLADSRINTQYLNESSKTHEQISNGTTIHNVQDVNWKGDIREYGKDQKTRKDPRIIGGYQCPHENYTFFVQVGQRPAGLLCYFLPSYCTDARIHWRCGGSVLSAIFILSAGHCFDHGNSYAIKTWNDKIYYGLKFYRDDTRFFNIFYHHDIAILSLEMPIEDETVKMVELPWTLMGSSASIVEFCQEALVMGYGITREDDPYSSPFLKCADAPVLTTKQCIRSYGARKVTDNMVCTLNTEVVEGACSGDSGGPLICNGVQIGIVSWTRRCGNLRDPIVYTKVDAYLDFITDVMGEKGIRGHMVGHASSLVATKSVYIVSFLVLIKLINT